MQTSSTVRCVVAGTSASTTTFSSSSSGPSTPNQRVRQLPPEPAPRPQPDAATAAHVLSLAEKLLQPQPEFVCGAGPEAAQDSKRRSATSERPAAEGGDGPACAPRTPARLKHIREAAKAPRAQDTIDFIRDAELGTNDASRKAFFNELLKELEQGPKGKHAFMVLTQGLAARKGRPQWTEELRAALAVSTERARSQSAAGQVGYVERHAKAVIDAFAKHGTDAITACMQGIMDGVGREPSLGKYATMFTLPLRSAKLCPDFRMRLAQKLVPLVFQHMRGAAMSNQDYDSLSLAVTSMGASMLQAKEAIHLANHRSIGDLDVVQHALGALLDAAKGIGDVGASGGRSIAASRRRIYDVVLSQAGDGGSRHFEAFLKIAEHEARDSGGKPMAARLRGLLDTNEASIVGTFVLNFCAQPPFLPQPTSLAQVRLLLAGFARAKASGTPMSDWDKAGEWIPALIERMCNNLDRAKAVCAGRQETSSSSSRTAPVRAAALPNDHKRTRTSEATGPGEPLNSAAPTPRKETS